MTGDNGCSIELFADSVSPTLIDLNRCKTGFESSLFCTGAFCSELIGVDLSKSLFSFEFM